MSGRVKVLRAMKILVVAGVLFTAFMGFAHTKAGRPILGWMGRLASSGSVCPLGYDKPASAEERMQKRSRLAQARRGEPLAEKRTVLSFTLGHTSRDDLRAWVKANAGKCKELASGFDIECSGPFFSSMASTLWLEFDSAGVLVSLRGVESYADVRQADALYEKLRAAIKDEKANLKSEGGSRKIADLEAGLLNQKSISAELGNLSANARLTNMGSSFVVSQDYAAF